MPPDKSITVFTAELARFIASLPYLSTSAFALNVAGDHYWKPSKSRGRPSVYFPCRLHGTPGVPTIEAVKDFQPLRPLRNPHLMTIAAALWRRRFPDLPPGVARLFETEPGTQVSAGCHWQENPRNRPTLVLLHGLEGSSESGYMLGTAEKAFRVGFNVVRANQRNCGDTENLTATLYHSGLSCDIRGILTELIHCDGLHKIFTVGFSMGGNLVLKMAGEYADHAPPQVHGFVAVAPAFDLSPCADALAAPRNFIYNRRFVQGLKSRMRRKARLFPDRYPIGDMREIRTVRGFDDAITAPYCGFRDAADYYEQCSALRLAASIRRPTLIMTAQDDPFVPFASFEKPAVRENPFITVVAPKHGGHCAFISNQRGDDRFWCEARIVEFCVSHSKLANAGE